MKTPWISQNSKFCCCRNCEGVETFHLEPAIMQLRDPHLLNPNSYANLTQIFWEILRIYADRQWIPLITEGVQHVLGLKMLRKATIA